MAAAPTIPVPRRNAGYAPVFQPGTPQFEAAKAQVHEIDWRKELGERFVPRYGDENDVPTLASGGSLVDQLKAFDPRTPSGLFDLASLFTPGPGGKGGKFGRDLTVGQEYLLDSLNNVRTIRPGEQPRWFQENLAEREMTPRTEYWHRYTASQRPEKGTPAYEMAKVMGVPRSDPLAMLRNYVEPPLGRAGEPLVGQSDPKLGLSRSEKPPWPFSAKQKKLIEKQYGRFPDYVKGMLAEIGIDDVNDLVRVISTIKRQQQQGRGGTANLGEYGGN